MGNKKIFGFIQALYPDYIDDEDWSQSEEAGFDKRAATKKSAGSRHAEGGDVGPKGQGIEPPHQGSNYQPQPLGGHYRASGRAYHFGFDLPCDSFSVLDPEHWVATFEMLNDETEE